MATSAPTQQQWDELEHAIDNLSIQAIIAHAYEVADGDMNLRPWVYELADKIANDVCLLLERTGWGLRGGKGD